MPRGSGSSINFEVRFATRGVEELRRNLAEGLNQIETTRASVDKLTRSLGGENVIRSAHNLAAAIQKIGGEAGALAGVEKLTFTELERANTTLDRAVQKYLALGQAIPTPIAALHQLIKAEVDAGHAAEDAAKETVKAHGVFEDLGKQILSTAAGFVSAQAAIGLVRGGFRAIVGELRDSIAAYAEAEAAQSKLVAALRQQGQATPEIVGRYNDLATQFQSTTVFSEDLINSMQALLVQVGGILPAQMEKALQASADLSAGLGVDLQTATTLVAKAAAGHTETLGRYGVTVTKAALETQGFEAVLDAINKQFGGQAAAQIETYAGKVDQLKNSWNNVQEAIGKAIVTNPIVVRGLTDAASALKSVDESANATNHSLADLIFTLTNSSQIAGFVAILEKAIDVTNTYEAATRRAAALPAPSLAPQPLALPDNRAALAQWDAELALNKKRSEEAAAAAEAHRKTLERLADEFSGAGLLRAAQDYEATIKRIGGIERLDAAEKKRLADEFQKVIDKYRQFGPAGKAVVDHFAALKLQLEPLPDKLRDIEDGFHGQANALDNLGTKIKPTLADLDAFAGPSTLKKIHDIESGFEGIGTAIDHVGFKIKPTFGDLKVRVTDSAGAMRELAGGFAALAQISGDSLFGVLVRGAATAVASIDSLTRAQKALQDTTLTTGQRFAITTGSVLEYATAIYSLVTTIGNALDRSEQLEEQQDRLSRTLRGLQSDLHQTTRASDQLARSIDELALNVKNAGLTRLFSTADEQNLRRGATALDDIARRIAEALKLPEILEDMGGAAALTADQLAAVNQRIEDLIVIAQSGGKYGAQALHTLDDVLADMGTNATKSGGLVDQFFLNAIKHAQELGLNLENVQQFLQGQASSAESGILSALKVTDDAYTKRADLLKQANDLTEQLGRQSGAEADATRKKIADLNAELAKQDAIINATAIGSKTAGDAVAGALLGIISSQVEAGKSFGEAIRAAAPGIESLKKQLEAAGVEGGAAFQLLQQQADLFTGEVTGPALQSIEGYVQGLKGLHNAGLLNQDTFQGITEQIGHTRDALVNQGVDGHALLVALQSPLQTLWELEQKFGYQADASTQALIDQAKQENLIGEDRKSVAEQMLDLQKQMAEAAKFTARVFAQVFGVDLPASLKESVDSTKDAASTIGDQLKNIKTPGPISIPIDFPIPPGATTSSLVAPRFGTEAFSTPTPFVAPTLVETAKFEQKGGGASATIGHPIEFHFNAPITVDGREIGRITAVQVPDIIVKDAVTRANWHSALEMT